MPLSRRRFLGAMSWPAAAIVAAGSPSMSSRILAAAVEAGRSVRAPAGPTPSEIARDEGFWWHVQQAFTPDRSLVNLNHGGVSAAPAVVQEAMRRHLELSNTAPAHVLWELLEPRKETVRRGIASLFGCDAEEVALTRNASESLQIVQCGLPLTRGDEVVTTDQDYPRMLTTFRQRERREGIVLRTLSLPVPAEDPVEVVERFERALSPRTRLILISHVVNLTGQILPVREVVGLGRARGIPVLVDGAHAFARLTTTRSELDCDYYGVSLHKWLCAPHGTGFLHVRRERIRDVWPLTAAPPEMDSDIRKFEEIGTHPAANTLATAEAIDFYRAVGPANVLARMHYLRDRWAAPLLAHEQVRLHSSRDPRFSSSIGTVEIRGVDVVKLQAHLWTRHRIFTTAIRHPQFEGIRVTPGLSTTLAELDRLVEAMETVVRNGLPA
jgi:selenocysteine lyase/cysteine desulfurase